MRREGDNDDDQKDPSSQETINFAGLPQTGSGAGCAVLSLDGSTDGQRLFPLARNPTVIGRSRNADLVLTDPTISDYHARIIRHSFGYTVEDMGSATGTYLGDRRINHARLVNGDVLRIGTTVVTFLEEQAGSRRDLPKPQVVALVPTRGTVKGVGSHQSLLRVHYPDPSNVRDFETQQIRGTLRTRLHEPGKEPEPSFEDALRRILVAARYLRRHAMLILMLAGLGLALGAASFMLLPPVRAAICMVTLSPAPKVNPIGQEGRQGSHSDEMSFFAGVERAITSSETVRSSLTQMGVANPSSAQADLIAKRLRFENLGNHLYLATYTPKLFDRRDEWHVSFLDVHIKNYLESEVEKKLKVFVAEVDFLRTQTDAAEKRVQEISQESVKYRESHSDQILAQNALGLSPSALESRRIEVAGQISRLTGELESVRSQLNRGSALSQARAQSGQSDREALAGLDRKLAELRAQGFADGHPDVQRLLTERKALQRAFDDHLRADVTQFERRSNAAYDALQSQADQLQAQLKAARSELAFIEDNRRSLRTVSGEMPKVNARLDELLRMKENAIRQHGLLFDRLKKAEIQLKLERVSASSRYEITVLPRLDYPPGRKAFLTRLGLGLAIGLGLALLVLGIGELRKLFMRIARETPAVMTIAGLLGAMLLGCAHDGTYVWVEDTTVKNQDVEPIIHPRDSLLVEVQKQPTLSGEFVVRDDGHYAHPMVGSIHVAGKTPSQVAVDVAAALRDIVVGPAVSVWITKTPPIRISVVGEVKTPGSFELTRDRSMLAALALAGWVTEFAHPDRIFVVRVGSSTRIRFRLQDITSAERHAAQFQLADSDVVVVE